ncbi:MAG: T9SS type A sorting domain-containing protein [Bacteroidales bacterium]|nr:T9SS type A sorting domain-containing protein [Bacteroidales bacterium]
MKNKFFIFSILTAILIINYLPGNTQNIPDFLVNEHAGRDGSAQGAPSIAGDGNGNYVVTWQDNRNGMNYDIYAQIYLSDGTKLGDNFKVSDNNQTAHQCRPSIAVDPNMNFVVTWVDKRNSWKWDIYAQRFSNDGTALGNNFKVNTDTTNEEQEHPTVAIDSCGNFVIVWADERSGEYDIYAQRYSYDGVALGDNFKINDDIGNYVQYWPTVSGHKNGDFIVTWVDKRNDDDYDIYFQRYLADGTAIGYNVKANTDLGDSYQLNPDIVIMESGDFIITWGDIRNENWDIYAQRFLSDGTMLGDNFKIYNDTTNANQSSPSISTDIAGNFIVSWIDSGNDYCAIYAQRFTSEAVPIGNAFKVNNDTGESYQACNEIMEDKDGNFTIIWEDHSIGNNGDVFAQSYLNDGTPIEDNFKVNDDIGSENQIGPSIAKDNNNNFIIAWTDERHFNYDYNYGDIYFQRFSGNGTTLGNNIKVNDDTLSNVAQYGASVASDAEGNFVIAWDDCRNGYWGDIYAQRFSNDGTALGNNFRVNYLSAWVNYGSKVICKKNGDFIIVWGDSEDGGKDGKPMSQQNDKEILKPELSKEKKNTEPDIYAQQYFSNGTANGANFKVNDDIGGTQQTNPDIAIDTNDNYIICWQDKRSGVWAIYIQRYLSDGTPIGNNLKVEDSLVSNYVVTPAISIDDGGNFVIAWTDQPNGNYDIFARCFLPDGTPIGDKFQVNNDSGTTNQTNPCVSVNGVGNFIITWTDRRNGNQDVYSQRYLSNGTPLGSNYRISNTGEIQQLNSTVVLGDERIYSTWQDNRSEQTGFDIWANIMNWDNFEQEISLIEGYQFISSNIDPDEPDMLNVLGEILDDNLSFVRNTSGQTLQKIGPNWVNGIGDWIVSEGYLVKMFADDSFSIDGLIVNPATPIPVEQGFQFVSYFPENDMDALIAFETILNDDLDYIRNSSGQTLRKIGPIWVNGIGDCQPGEGYLVKMFSPDEIIYPASAKSSSKTNIAPKTFIFKGGNAADPVYTIYITGLEIGEEVASFDGDKLIGATRINSQNAYDNELPVFSTLINEKGYEAGNPISFKVWSENNIVPADFTMEAIYDSYVSDVYPEGDGNYSVVNITKEKNENTEETITVYPNPTTGTITIQNLQGFKKLEGLIITDIRGKTVLQLTIKNYQYSTEVDLSQFEKGIYFISFSGKNFKEIKKIVIQ